MIEKVLFDLGNVLLRFDFDRVYAALALYDADIAALKGSAMDALKIKFETGLISNEAMFQRAAELSGYTGSRAHFEQSWQDIFVVNAPMLHLLKDLRSRQIPCYLLSNSNDLHVRHIRETYEVLEPFNDIIFSHEVKAMKPGEAIFEQAITKFDLAPNKTVFIDDLAANIETGRRLGFHCVHYDPDAHEAAENEFRGLGLIPA